MKKTILAVFGAVTMLILPACGDRGNYTAEYFYEASDDQGALSADSPENAMLGAVTANFESASA
jgi:hypothetical protein